jgi:hypothetical protein
MKSSEIYDGKTKNTFAFSDTFIHLDMMAYLDFYIPVRSRNWELRNASLKKLVCLFHAFHKQNYLRMMPYHLADLQTFPSGKNLNRPSYQDG